MPSPLDGLRVIELATVLAGPSVGQFLAELGAEVVKVEPPQGGDVTRTWKLPEEDPKTDRSAYFTAINWGKRSVALDLGASPGRSAMHRLVEEADIVVTSFKPGAAAKLGADATTLRGINPRLIVAQLTGYDEEDSRPGYDAVIQAEAGYMSMNGQPDSSPTKLPVALMDILAAAQLKQAILVALLRRERTGEGATITVSLMDAAISGLANQASNYLNTGRVPTRIGSEHPNIAPYGTPFRTADGRWLVIAVGTDRQFKALCDILSLGHLFDAPTFANNQKRVRNRPFLHALLEEQVLQWKRDDLLAELHAHQVPSGSVNDLSEVFEHPARHELVLRDEETGLATVRNAVFSLDGFDPLTLQAPPEFNSSATLTRDAAPRDNGAIRLNAARIASDAVAT